ncbi:MAG: ribosome small subunit-dependent GTPase A [Sporomusaceae bacterium]|jgi:ribosome biogenesis GTPase|nr:ribosome small subunit-dependent GTPase A [Sporomusaceae bacterium]
MAGDVEKNQGRVVKTYNSYYYVDTGGERVACRLRGRFKQERFSLVVGDEVIFAKTGSGEGIIEKILPRHSLLKRPAVANVDQALLVFAAANPDLNPALLDQFLVLAEQSRLDIIICINKADLAVPTALAELAAKYRGIGYQILFTSTKDGRGLAELKASLQNKISVFSGPSGVGKSSLLNLIEPGFNLQTGQVSQKIGRGKHTTRFAELFRLAGGAFVVDTPGFSFTEFDDFTATELAYYFPEFEPFLPGCKFNTCLHLSEPGCQVKQAVADRLILAERYASYVDILQKIKEKRRVY